MHVRNEIDFASETLMHHLQCKTCILVYIALSNAFLSLQKNKTNTPEIVFSLAVCI